LAATLLNPSVPRDPFGDRRTDNRKTLNF
jgi:hypothetical protein